MYKPEFCSELKLRHKKTGDLIFMVIFFDKNILRWTRGGARFEIQFSGGDKMKTAVEKYFLRKKISGWVEC